MDAREEVSLEISSILAAEKMNKHIPVAKLDQLYQEMISERIPYKKLGFSTLVDFLKTLDFIEVYYQSGHHHLDFLGTKNTKHVSDLVAKQRNNNNRKKNHSRRNIPSSYFQRKMNTKNNTSDYRRHDYDDADKREKLARSLSHCVDDDKLSGINDPKTTYYFDDDPNPHLDWELVTPTVDKDNNGINDDDNTTDNYLINRFIGRNSVCSDDNQGGDKSAQQRPVYKINVSNDINENDKMIAGKMMMPEYPQQDNDDNKSRNDDNIGQKKFYDTICPKTRFRLEKLIQSKPNGIWCAQLPKTYHDEYKLRLDWEDYEFDGLIQFVNELPEIFQFDRDGKNGDFMIYDANRPIPGSSPHLEERKKLVSDYQLYASLESLPALESLPVVSFLIQIFLNLKKQNIVIFFILNETVINYYLFTAEGKGKQLSSS